MVRGFAILLGLQWLGVLLSTRFNLPLPGSVVGMVLMLIVLRVGLVKLEWVTAAAELLLKNLSMLFVPAGVGVMVYFELISRQWLSLTVATVVSTVAAIAVTGLTAKVLTCRGDRS